MEHQNKQPQKSSVMSKSNEKKSSNNIVTGVTAAAVGGAAGIVVGSVVMPNSADAQEVSPEQPGNGATHHSESQPSHQSHTEAVEVKPEQTGENYVESEPNDPSHELNEPTEPDVIDISPEDVELDGSEPIEPYVSETVPQIDVISCDIIETVDGDQMELAVVNVDGVEVALADINMNGEADLLMCDVNNDGVIDNDEVEDISGQGVSMSLFESESAHAGTQDDFFDDSLMAENDLPDYVNDADVDSFMA